MARQNRSHQFVKNRHNTLKFSFWCMESNICRVISQWINFYKTSYMVHGQSLLYLTHMHCWNVPANLVTKLELCQKCLPDVIWHCTQVVMTFRFFSHSIDIHARSGRYRFKAVDPLFKSRWTCKSSCKMLKSSKSRFRSCLKAEIYQREFFLWQAHQRHKTWSKIAKTAKNAFF